MKTEFGFTNEELERAAAQVYGAVATKERKEGTPFGEDSTERRESSRKKSREKSKEVRMRGNAGARRELIDYTSPEISSPPATGAFILSAGTF